MNNIGEFALLLALATAIYGVVSYVMAVKGNRVDLYFSADNTAIIFSIIFKYFINKKVIFF